MTPRARATTTSLRMLFEIARDDNPRLYDDLMRFNKGPKRVNRLRFLAYEGLLVQLGFEANADLQKSVASAPYREVDAGSAGHTIQAFELPADT
ncbi:hypothetical protein [Pseudomonas bubulae]|mgnify:CR=1 FL=1|uniref:hypothetical protein n=1 Tax=Pseudomonas bubulae TaxID=2316085 RepID=UPI002B1D0BE2|nr:hypothetical protein [Pseudomonas bubulae]